MTASKRSASVAPGLSHESWSEHRQHLLAGAGIMGIELSEQQVDVLINYIRLLQRWNRVYNLTAVQDSMTMISRHLLDSLVLMRYLNAGRLLDIGCGAGLPGIPLAVAEPALACTLVDSVGKKIRFVQHVITELCLPNCTAFHQRVERLTLQPFDTLVSRAVAKPADIIAAAGFLCTSGGRFIFMLGQKDKAGFEHGLPAGYDLATIDSVTVPFERGERHIAVCVKTGH